MANNAAYDLQAVAKDRQALERLISIMKYQDPEYFIYRVFSVEHEPIEEHEDGYFSVLIFGDVAWGTSSWFDGNENEEWKAHANDAHYITLDLLAPRLGIAVECYCEEEGCEFQSHHLCSHNGLVRERYADWHRGDDDDGEDDDGGLEDYGTWHKPSEIWEGVVI